MINTILKQSRTMKKLIVVLTFVLFAGLIATQAFAQTAGYEVCLCDINEQFAANGKAKIAKGFEKSFRSRRY